MSSNPQSQGNNESSLLAELAGEATSKLQAIQTETQAKQARTQQLNNALQQIYQFLHTFAGYVNKIAPNVPRAYNIDANTAFTSLKWQNAVADYRKQSLSDSALIDHVAFNYRLLAPEPVVVTRRWNQLDALKKELEIYALRSLDDLDKLVLNKSQQETFSVRLIPEFFVKLKFQGDYNEGFIDIKATNFDVFGPATFKLNPESVTKELLDDLGRFLIGRTSELPLPFRLARSVPKPLL